MAFGLNKINSDSKFKKYQNNVIEKYKCIITKFLFKDEYTGFYVFNAELLTTEKTPNITIDNKLYTDRKFVVTGISEEITNNISEFQEVEIWGKFEIGKTNSIQFTASSVQEIIPTKPGALEIFLGSGKIHTVGKVTAKKIVSHFGLNTINILDNEPDRLLELKEINEKKLEIIKNSWKEWRDKYEIISKMKLYGVSDSSSIKIHNYFGNQALDIIKNEPYTLTEVEGIGFTTADKIAKEIGISSTDPQRIEKCILFLLEQYAENGSTASPKEDLIHSAQEMLEIDSDLIRTELNKLNSKNVVVEKILNIKQLKSSFNKEYIIVKQPCISHRKYDNVEINIANQIKRLLEDNKVTEEYENQINNYIEENPFELDKSQVKATQNILRNKFAILTGGPGTGKTHTIKSILSFFERNEKIVTVISDDNSTLKYENDLSNLYINVLAAPTGRAAKRIEESTKRESSTIHRLLGYKDGDFEHNEQNKLKGDVFIIDESSMIDVWLMSALLKAIPSHAKVIFVGDTDQLPSVGAGKVLDDMINSQCISVSKLEEPHRQALDSNIIVAAYDIINKKMPKLYDINSDSDFAYKKIESDEEIQNEIISIVADLLHKGINSEDIQILTPKKESNLGINNLNKILRPILNSNYLGNEDMKNKFIAGDRVMQFKNNKELEIYNGDTGKVIDYSFDTDKTTIKFDKQDLSFDENKLHDINLSYAITIHKSQGSDYPYVIIPLSKSHTYMWDVNLLYTAVTRGKKRVILVGEEKTLQYAINNIRQNSRITGLKEQILKVFNKENTVDVVNKEENTISNIDNVNKKPNPFQMRKKLN